MLHRFQVHAIARDDWRLLVLDQHLLEARSITCRVLGHHRAVRGCFLHQAESGTAGFWNDVVGVSLAFILLAFAVLACLDGIVEGGLHLLRRLHGLHRHVGDDGADLVAVENLLHQLLRIVRHLFAALVQHEVHLAAADHFADRRFGDLAQGVFLVARVEQPRHGIFQGVLHRELDVDDVFIVRQHQRFAGLLVAQRLAVTHFHRAHLRHVDGFVGLERVRPAPVETGRRGVAVLAEREHDAVLALLHDERAAGEPDEDGDHADHAGGDAGALHVGTRTTATAVVIAAVVGTVLLSEKGVQALIEIAPQLIEVRRTFAGLFAFLGFLAVVLAIAPAGIVQGQLQACFFE
ncbi:hypothetical protein D3C72_1020280 [compost metagenome]